MNNNILGLAINQFSLKKLIENVIFALESHNQIVFACANPHSLSVAESDKQFKNALLNAEQLVSDGIGIILIGKLFGLDLRPRITGTDYFLAVNNAVSNTKFESPVRMFYFGSSEHVLALIKAKMKLDYPNIELCGMLSPPFGEWSVNENEKMIGAINSAKPDILWVGMTAPKQEKWVYENREKLNVKIIGSIGAVFDFYAGTYPRAPELFRKIGLEWLYRLIKEPRRLWKRTFVSVPKFIIALLKDRFSGN